MFSLTLPGNFQPTSTLSFALFAAAAVLYVLVSRLYLHPLASFPGPRLAAFTYLYPAYYELWKDGAFVKHIEGLHRIYGPVVRIGPNELHFNSPEAYFSIYAARSGFSKEPHYYSSFGIDESSFGYIDIQEHKKRKDVLNPLFSRRAILKFEHLVSDIVNSFVERLRQYGDKPINLQNGFIAISMDIITTYSYGQSFGGVSAPGFSHPIPPGIEAMNILAHAVRFFPPLKLLAELPLPVVEVVNKDMGHLLRSLSSQIDRILANPGALQKDEHETIYHHLLPDSVNPKEWPSKKSLFDEAKMLLAAGTDTTANALNLGFYNILANPEVMRNLVQELITAWPDKDSPFSYEQAEKLPYLTGVIKESLRQSVGVPVPMPRVAEVPTVIDGVPVPAGTIVSTSARCVLFDPSVFPDPHLFKPERWLTEDSKALDKYLVVFSRGPRSCLGLNLAWCELYTVFSHLVRKFEMQIHNTGPEDMVYRDYFIPVWRGRPLCATLKEYTS